MERENVILKHEMHQKIVQPFLKEAFKEGAHRIKPKRKSKDQWFRQIMIGVVYNDIGSSATVEELANRHGAFKQSISDSNKFFLRNLWKNSSPKVQDRYPLNEILTARKPLSQRSKERTSLRKGGSSLKIRRQFENGVRDIDTISKNTGILKTNIASAISTTLKDWGVIVPTKYRQNKELLMQLDKETDDEKIQALLDRIPHHVIQGDLDRKREASQFSSFSPLIREAGFSSRDNHPFATSLKSTRVPISIKDEVVKGANPKTLTYYVLLSRHKERAIKALKEDQSLQRFQR